MTKGRHARAGFVAAQPNGGHPVIHRVTLQPTEEDASSASSTSWFRCQLTNKLLDKALQEELTRLKNEQMELKKEATAAAAAMPAFSYRSGAGLRIDAADQSWGIRFRYLFHIDMTFLEGQDARRNGDFELFGRRNRPEVTYFWHRGFYEFRSEIDMDAGDATEIQRATLFTHYNKLNPWFPTFRVGMDNPATINEYDRGSNRTAATAEHNLIRRDNGWNTGSHTGSGFVWDKLAATLVPGIWDSCPK